MTQGLITITIAFLCIAIPFGSLIAAVNQTPKHAFACPECDADVPAGIPRCPNCGHAMPEQALPV